MGDGTAATDEQAKDRHYGVRLVRGPFVRLPAHPEPVRASMPSCLYGPSARRRRALGRRSLQWWRRPEPWARSRRVPGGARRRTGILRRSRRTASLRRADTGLGSWRHRARCADREAGFRVPELSCWPAGRLASLSRRRGGARSGIGCGTVSRSQRRAQDLWRSFLEIVRVAMPPAVVMENVPDMALDREMFILRTMVHELEGLGYAVEERVVDTWRYGVPAVSAAPDPCCAARRDRFRWPAEIPDKTTVWNAIGDLPEVKGGWRPEAGASGWAPYDGPMTDFPAADARRDRRRGHRQGLRPHHTARCATTTSAAFQQMYADTRYSDLPEAMRRYRA